MNWGQFVVQWLHVILGMLWLGGALYTNFVLIPALGRLPLSTQREVGAQIGDVAGKVFTVVPILLVILGIIRGTIYGPLHSAEDVLGTAYGITWLVALVATVATWLWGKLVIEGAIAQMNATELNADGTLSAQGMAELSRVKQVALLELLGFAVIFTCMILMRFGL
jgi:uncharacterized membrane protein